MIRFFLCHASEDKPVVRKVGSDLRRFGADVWIDESSITAGDSLRESIEHGLETSDFVLVFLSGSSVCKEWVKRELSAALSLEVDRNRKTIIPLLVDDCDVPLLIRDKLYVDLREDYKKGIELILKSSGLTNSGQYPESIETLECKVELDIVSDDGTLVNYVKEQTIRCIQGVSKGYTESFSPDGWIGSFSSNPGTIGNVYKESGAIYIPVEYPSLVHSGETLKRIFSCTWHDSFIENSEYWEQRQHHPSSNVTIRVIFPENRSPAKYWVEHKHGSVLKETSLEALFSRSGNRVVITLEVRRPIYLHSYLLKWEW